MNERLLAMFEALLAENEDVLRRLKDEETPYTVETFRQSRQHD